ncbi:hypothetical protein D3C87_1373990 [compost metagenome]
MHFDLDQRIGLGKPSQNPRQKTHHVIVRRTDAHGADHVRFAQSVEHFAVQLEDAPRITQQHLALGGEPHLPSVTLEQLTLQHIFFQPFHLHADGRLGAMDQFTGAGKAALVGNRDKGAQHFGIDRRVARHTSISEMVAIRNICWIDLRPGAILEPSKRRATR